jgi:hypothetical protein
MYILSLLSCMYPWQRLLLPVDAFRIFDEACDDVALEELDGAQYDIAKVHIYTYAFTYTFIYTQV